jgi:hypothetical protein
MKGMRPTVCTHPSLTESTKFDVSNISICKQNALVARISIDVLHRYQNTQGHRLLALLASPPLVGQAGIPGKPGSRLQTLAVPPDRQYWKDFFSLACMLTSSSAKHVNSSHCSPFPAAVRKSIAGSRVLIPSGSGPWGAWGAQLSQPLRGTLLDQTGKTPLWATLGYSSHNLHGGQALTPATPAPVSSALNIFAVAAPSRPV